MLPWLPVLLLLAAPSIEAAASQEAAAAAATKDRLSEARMEALVAYPIRLVREGRVEAGEAAFEKLLRVRAARHELPSSDEADLLTAFGILLFAHFQLDDLDSHGRRAVPYLRRAVSAYRSAFGSEHPETALALNSYADALIETNDEAPREAESALREALAIRTETLGWTHKETVAGLARLADIRSRPARIGRDAEETAALLRQLLELVPVAEVEGPLSDPFSVRLRLAELYIANRRIPEALEVVDGAVQRGHGLCGTAGLLDFGPRRSLPVEVARLLRQAGHKKDAGLLEGRHPGACGPAARRP